LFRGCFEKEPQNWHGTSPFRAREGHSLDFIARRAEVMVADFGLIASPQKRQW